MCECCDRSSRVPPGAASLGTGEEWHRQGLSMCGAAGGGCPAESAEARVEEEGCVAVRGGVGGEEGGGSRRGGGGGAGQDPWFKGADPWFPYRGVVLCGCKPVKA